MRAAYITADRIGTATGGGAVTINELEALKETVGVDNMAAILGAGEVNPQTFGQPYNVFLEDAFGLYQVRDLQVNLAHFYSGTFSLCVRHLREHGARVTYTVPAHDRRVTVEEFGRLGIAYPYNHISDDRLWRLFSQGYREADVVIAPSNASAEFLRAEGCQYVVVIPHGHEPVDREKLVPLPQEFKVGYLGQTGPDKGLSYLLQGWARLNYQRETLVLAGDGTERLAGYINSIAGRGQFQLLGRIPRASALYNSVSVYCQSSVCEAFGIEVLEAWAHGRPVIVSQGAGASELVEEGVDGFVVPIRDPGAIADRIDWCRRNQEKLPEMGWRGQQKAAQFTWERIRERYKALWQSLSAS